jgi:hypothetical protein
MIAFEGSFIDDGRGISKQFQKYRKKQITLLELISLIF